MSDWLSNFNHGFLAQFEPFRIESRRLQDALLYSVNSPGKRLRPRFVQEASKLVHLSEDVAKHLSYSIEMIHVFSLIHDDLPCLDNDDFRRGLPTVHKKFDEGTALLTGDALVPLAYETFSKTFISSQAQNFNRALQYLSKCIGPEGMIGGQMLETELSFEPSFVSLEKLIKIQDLKTGALFRASLLLPFYLKGIPESEQLFQDTLKFATAFGFAFQIADDLEDEAQDQKQSAKNILSLMGKKAAIKLAIDQLKDNAASEHFTASEQLIKKLAESP
jgi:geranylgeranyl pyrophosphate synthase